MMLILANEEDSLAHAVYRVARRSGHDILMCADAELVEGNTRDGSAASALRCAGRRLPCSELDGVLFRLPACWWRSETSTANDDLVGAWYTTLWNLPSPVVNRFGLSWWFDSAGYSVQLALLLNAALRPFPTPFAGSEPICVYVAGDTFVPAGPEAEQAAAWLSGCGAAVARWQAETGISVARLTLRGRRIADVDACPLISGESCEIVQRLAPAVHSMLTGRT
jgi:hypothetical protein